MHGPSKVVLITGGSEGIGAASVSHFLARGWKVVSVSLPHDGTDRTEHPNLLAIAGDITLEQTRLAAVQQTLQRFNRIDILVNNAGAGFYALPSAASLPLARRLFEVNVFAPLAISQLVIPVMRRQGSGTIVNIGSIAGAVSLPWSALYSASKSALHTIDDALRRELKADGIHVIKVYPGIVNTHFRDNVLAGAPPATVAVIKRVISADTVAAAIVHGIEKRRRSVYVPWIGRVFAAMEFLAPRLMDWYLGRFLAQDIRPQEIRQMVRRERVP